MGYREIQVIRFTPFSGIDFVASDVPEFDKKIQNAKKRNDDGIRQAV